MPPRKPRPFYIHPKRAQIVRMLLAGRRNADITSELKVGKQIVSDLRKDLSMSRSQLSQKGGGGYRKNGFCWCITKRSCKENWGF